MTCPPKNCKSVKKVREEDRAVHENGSTKILATLPTARREGSKGTGRRPEKKPNRIIARQTSFCLKAVTETFLKKFGQCTLKTGETSKIHVFRFYLPVQHRD
jgi:hypothetical protein